MAADDFSSAPDKLALPSAVDRICEEIAGGRLLTEIALEWGVKLHRLRYWIAADSSRSARVREARRLSSIALDEKAQTLLADAKDDFELKKAKELAHHLRWKASKIDPDTYGEKIEHSGVLDVRTASEKQLANELASLGLSEVADKLLPRASAEGARVH